MRKWFILLVTLVLLVPTSVRAQAVVALKSLNVHLWSEYDEPSMLVIYDFEVTDDTQVPASMDIPIPIAANITAVAYESGGQLLLANYKKKPVEDAYWQTITLFITERTTYHIEYYLPLKRDGNKRSFNYRWTGGYSIDEFNINVQVPEDSKDVKTNPAIPFVQEQPFLSGGAMMNGLDEGQTYELKLYYSRASETSVLTPPPSQVVEPIAPVNENTDGRSTLNNLPLFLGGFGAVLILIALFYFLRSQSAALLSKPRRRGQQAQVTGAQTYCHECGARAHEGDRFCRTCGSKFRVS
jgi:hypothetical protein